MGDSDMEASMSEEHLLQDFADEHEAPFLHHKRPGRKPLAPRVLWLAIACFLASHAFLLIQFQRLAIERPVQYELPPHNKHLLGLSKFADLSYDMPTTYHNYTDFMSHNQSLSDELWDNISTSPLEVALTDQWATEHDLPLSVFRFPWDETKGVYFLRVFHGLHCLKAMRKAYADLERGYAPQIHPWHVYHCFDALRQDIMCNVDDTPMPTTDLPNKVGNAQVRMCRNFDDLIKWTREPERHACYHRFTDYSSVKNKIEMYGYCPEDSPYYPLQQAYFAKWGHHDPFGREDMEVQSNMSG